jgi:PAS domain S-box-containing protein
MTDKSIAQLFFSESSEGLLAVDVQSGTIVEANSVFCTFTGYSRDALVGEHIGVLSSLHRESDPKTPSRDRHLDAMILRTPGFHNDVSLNSAAGETRWTTVRVRHVSWNNTTLSLAVVSDDTERQLLIRDLTAKHHSLEQAYVELERVHSQLEESQQRMAHAAKLSALGELAAGLSHELNQPLTSIKGFSQELCDRLKSEAKPSKKDFRAGLQVIVDQSNKMAALLSHFRSMARRDPTERAPLDAKAIWPEDVLATIRRLLDRQLSKKNILLCMKLDTSKRKVWFNETALEQVIVNLISNSRDGISEQQKRDPSFQGRIQVSSVWKGSTYEIRVQDNGCGIPPTLQKKIFDPFFTTKEPGAGMGLGLSIAFSLVHQLQGDLQLESSSGSGTTFVLTLASAETQKKDLAA